MPLWMAITVLLAQRWRPGALIKFAPVTPRTAGGLVAAAWAVAFGTATVRAILYAISPTAIRPVDSGPALLRAVAVDYLLISLFAVFACSTAARRVGTTIGHAGLRWPARDRRSRREFVAVTVVCLAAQQISFSVGSVLLPASRSPWDRQLTPGVHAWFDLDAVTSAAAAAIAEELLVVMVPVLLLRAAGVSTRRIVVVALALRLSYHLYYRWLALSVLLWGAVFLGVYLVRGWIWPQLIAHFGFDLLNSVHLVDWIYQLAWTVAFLLPVGLPARRPSRAVSRRLRQL